MRLSVTFETDELILPVQYERALQGLIYHSLSNPELVAFLHERGFTYNKRTFKLFTFSKLQGKCSYNPKRKTLTFNGDVKWIVSSALPEFIQDLGQALLLEERLELYNQSVKVKEMTYHHSEITESVCRVNMLSPITVASTFDAEGGRKVTQYYSPHDIVFSPMIEKNLKRKYAAFTNEENDDLFEISPVTVSYRHKVITKFKGTIINAWGGTYELRSSPKLLTFAYQVGLGSRNSAGFGLFELV